MGEGLCPDASIFNGAYSDFKYPKVGKRMASMAVIMGLGLLFFILLGSTTDDGRNLAPLYSLMVLKLFGHRVCNVAQSFLHLQGFRF